LINVNGAVLSERPENTTQISFAQELLRKSTHMGAMIIPGGYYLLELTRVEMLSIMIPATLMVILGDIARLRDWSLWSKILSRFFDGMIRPHERAGDFSGAAYILSTVCLVVAIYDKSVVIAALAFIIVGDTLAALIGRRFGKHKYGKKSIEGSLACLVGTVAVALITPDLPLLVGISGAFVATVVEGLPLKIDDNVSVPILSGLYMTLFIKFLAFL